jgi:hypothetical protein
VNCAAYGAIDCTRQCSSQQTSTELRIGRVQQCSINLALTVSNYWWLPPVQHRSFCQRSLDSIQALYFWCRQSVSQMDMRGHLWRMFVPAVTIAGSLPWQTTCRIIARRVAGRVHEYGADARRRSTIDLNYTPVVCLITRDYSLVR